MGAKMGQVRSEAGCQKSVSVVEPRGIEEPRQEQSTIRVGSERNGVQDYSSRDASLNTKALEDITQDCSQSTYLLLNRDVWALETSAHAASAETTLSDLPQPISH